MSGRGKDPKSRTPESLPQSKTLKEIIESTAAERDAITKRLMLDLIAPGKTARKFVTDACKFAGIRPPRPDENLAPFVYQLQKNVCKFSEVDNAEGCDGKLGPITFKELIKQIHQLKALSREARTKRFRAERQSLAQSSGLPSMPGSSVETNPDLPKIDPKKVVMIGDSLTHGVGHFFYKGTGKFGKYNRKYFKIGRSVRTSYRLLERQLPLLKSKPAYTVWLGTNDLSYRSADYIFDKLERIYTALLKNNPNARIVAITLLPYSKYQHKIDEVNQKIREFVRTHSSNMSLVDLHSQVIRAQQNGYNKLFYGDHIHLREKYYSAISKMLKEHLTQNQNRDFTDYL